MKTLCVTLVLGIVAACEEPATPTSPEDPDVFYLSAEGQQATGIVRAVRDLPNQTLTAYDIDDQVVAEWTPPPPGTLPRYKDWMTCMYWWFVVAGAEYEDADWLCSGLPL